MPEKREKPRVNDLKTQLREKHESQFSGVQYALWAETIVAGTHESLEEPPPVPMFGAQRPRGHSRGSGNLTDALTVMADKLATALTQPNNPSASGTISSPNSSSGNYCSPSKSAELRGKYIHQLRELVDLRDIGALTGEEFEDQRCAIVNLMKSWEKMVPDADGLLGCVRAVASLSAMTVRASVRLPDPRL